MFLKSQTKICLTISVLFHVLPPPQHYLAAGVQELVGIYFPLPLLLPGQGHLPPPDRCSGIKTYLAHLD